MSAAFFGIILMGILTGSTRGQNLPMGSMAMGQNVPPSAGGANINSFNLNTQQGIMGFLQAEGINPSQLVTSNCVTNGNTCTPGGQPCCLNPVFTCQPNRSGPGNACYVIPMHAPHIPQIRQILKTYGVSTQKPIQ